MPSSESTESPPAAAPTRAAPAAPAAPVPDRLSLEDFLSREPRLRARPTLSGGFARQCARRQLTHGTLADFTAALDAFANGAT